MTDKRKFPRKNSASETIAVRFPHEMVTAIRKHTEKNGITNSEFIKDSVMEKMERLGIKVKKK